MTTPQKEEPGSTAEMPSPSAAFFAFAVAGLRQRSDFLAIARAGRQGTASFLLQGRARDDGQDLVRIGFTATKKIGNAVARNRAKRRMRALAQELLPTHARPGWDYVLVARPEATIVRGFTDMRADLLAALRGLHGKAR